MATAHKILPVSDRVQRAKDLLLAQFKDSPNLNGLVEALVEELQVFETTVTDLQTVRTLNGSYGWWLDRIGEELKVDRGNYGDDDYKTAIKIAMAKKTSSATAQDILRLVYLLTADDSATLTNNYPYLMELTSFLFCVADSPEGLQALSELFPVNTRVRLIKKGVKPFKFGTSGQGFGSGSTLNSLVYFKNGSTDDPRFSTSVTEYIPPVIPVSPFNLTPPFISGGDQEGDVLVCTEGEWGGDTPITITYQWLRDGAAIGGEVNSTYTLVLADVNTSIVCRVTATNAAGDSSFISNEIIVSAVAPVAPLITNDMGVESVYGSDGLTFLGDTGTATATINFNSDGTTQRSETTELGTDVVNSQWLTTTGVGAGDDYVISYSVISGVTPTGILPNIEYALSSNRTMSLNVSDNKPNILSGTYNITIRSTVDSSVVANRTISISVEVYDAVN